VPREKFRKGEKRDKFWVKKNHPEKIFWVQKTPKM